MLTRLRLVARAAVIDPRLIADYFRLRRSARAGGADPAPGTAPDALSLPAAIEALRAELGHWSDGPAVVSLREGLPSSASADHGLPGMTGDPVLGEVCYAVIRGTRPDVVLETGVAAGMTSAYILAALADNGTGTLHSIDLPDPGHLIGKHVGELIPDALRSRWTYHWGAAQRLLEPTLARTATQGRRVFVHDSDHRYAHMRWELETARRELSPGDWIVADDVNQSAAFEDFAAAAGLSASYVEQREKAGSVGLVQLR